MNAAIAIGRGNTAYLRFVAKFRDITSGWGTTTTAITDGEWVTVRISSTAITGGNYFHGTIYTYDVPEYTFSVINGAWSALNRNLVQSDYDTLNSAITTTNTDLSSLSSTVTSNKSAQDTKNSSYESRLTAVESKATTYATITDMDTKADKGNYATVEYVDGRVANLVNSAPETLDTLNELANALGNDPNFATTVSTQIGQKANKTDVDSQIQNVNTELATHNTDSSAHTAILNAIKAITGMSSYDIAPSNTIAGMIPLLGFGGIVAQKLDSNGYVKFANGSTIQWGAVTATTGAANSDKISESEAVFTFPTAFTSEPWAIFTGPMEAANVRLESACVVSKTPTDIHLLLDALGFANVKLSAFVLAIGN